VYGSKLISSGDPSLEQKAGAMSPAQKKKVARRLVTERLRLFYEELKRLLADGTELWRRAEQKDPAQPKPDRETG